MHMTPEEHDQYAFSEMNRGWHEAEAARLAAEASVLPTPVLPHDALPIDLRDAEIAELKERVAALERAVKALQRRADRDADFEDWKTGQGRGF